MVVKGDDIMATHFLVEGADTGSYRELRSIRGGLKAFCFSPLCCLLTVPSRGGGSRMGPHMEDGAFMDAGGSVRSFVQGERRLHERLL